MTPYLSVADASSWLAAHVSSRSAWGSDASAQVTALEEASDHIDALPLKGLRYFPLVTQSREFPRFDPGLYQVNPDALYLSAYDPSKVPQEVKDACCLEALAILDSASDSDLKLRKKLQDSGVSSVGFRGRNESYVPGANQLYRGMFSKRAYDKIKYWVAGSMEAI